MNSARRLGAQSLLFILGAVATLGCWVIAIFILFEAALADFRYGLSAWVIWGGLVPALGATVMFARTARLPITPASILLWPGLALMLSVAALAAVNS